jgi:hypothetical protein
MQFLAVRKSVVKDRERHHLLIALIVRREGVIICKGLSASTPLRAGCPGDDLRWGRRSIFARMRFVVLQVSEARSGAHGTRLDYSNIKSIFFINRKSLSGWVAKGVNSFSM